MGREKEGMNVEQGDKRDKGTRMTGSDVVRELNKGIERKALENCILRRKRERQRD